MGRPRKDGALSPRIRFDLRRMGVGVLAIVAPQTSQTKLQGYYGVIRKLIADDQVEVLKALHHRQVTLSELVDLDRRGRLQGSEILGLVVRQKPLFDAWDGVASRLGRPASKRRYAVTRLTLAKKYSQFFSSSMTVDDLARLDWPTIAAAWHGSNSDWNHTRKAVSRLLTVLFGSKHHPFRRSVVDQIPIKPEAQRVPNISVALFWRIVEKCREDVRPALVTLVATGMRLSEYLACDESNLLEEIQAVKVPGTKTEGSMAVVAVDPRFWPWIKQGIPSPLQQRCLRLEWKRALEKAEAGKLWLHDLRHLHAQLASDHGESATAIASSLRHANVQMTMRYARTTDTRNVSRSVANRLFEGAK